MDALDTIVYLFAFAALLLISLRLCTSRVKRAQFDAFIRGSIDTPAAPVAAPVPIAPVETIQPALYVSVTPVRSYKNYVYQCHSPTQNAQF